MILVDSSVWIDYFRSSSTPEVELLESLLGTASLAIGDLIAAEVLQGVRNDREYRIVERVFDAFDHVDLVGYDLALRSAENYRRLRVLGFTIRKTIDVLIATRCIEDGLTLLHADRDFDPFERHLGLQVATLSNSSN